MKRIIIILMLLPSFLYSQEKGTFDCSVGAGIMSTNFMIDVLTDVVTFGIASERSTLRSPSFYGTFKYAVKDNWFVNADGVYELMKDDLLNKKDVVIDNRVRSFYSLGVGTEYHYIHEDIVQVYSGAAIGYTFETSKTNTKQEYLHYLNGHLNLIGIRIGKKLAGSLEFGLGYKGIFTAGVSYQF